MINIPCQLLDGYRLFRRDLYPMHVSLYRNLSENQSPRTMIVACADSRVDPSAIFSAGPGDLFVVRNVANLIPPCESGGSFHGTSAAIEFAVTGLKVHHIVIMGHAFCGGIKACLDEAEARPVGRFIGPWVGIASAARDAVLSRHGSADERTRQRELEFESIKHSIARLKDYPFVAEAMRGRDMEIHGAWFSIADGELFWLDQGNDVFTRVPHGEPSGSAGPTRRKE